MAGKKECSQLGAVVPARDKSFEVFSSAFVLEITFPKKKISATYASIVEPTHALHLAVVMVKCPVLLQ